MGGAGKVLSRSSFLVLLALSDQARHGLGILDEIEAGSGGRVRMGPGTLYGTIQKLVEEALIVETSEAPDPTDDDPRRRYYRITPEGSRAVSQEAERMSALVDAAVVKRVLGGT